MRKTGEYQKLGNLEYFIPYPLPPVNPPLELSSHITELYGQAHFSLGQLNAMSKRLPSIARFIKAYVIKEALLSSAIEGIHTTLVEVFTQPLETNKPNKETQLVLNYTHALQAALDMIQKEGYPLANRVILAAHKTLMSGQGDKSAPGNYRKQSVKVGNLVPPSAPHIPELMAQLEKYINQNQDFPPLIQAGLVHVHFETIHPFLDGNGRIGRLLIVLMLIEAGLLSAPILYPSYYFKKNHLKYYQQLDRVRTHGDFESWITFYLNAINESSIDAYQRAQEIEQLEQSVKNTIQTSTLFAKIRETALGVVPVLFEHPIFSITQISQATNKAYNTAQHTIAHFIEAGVVVEHTHNRSRNKLYRFAPYIEVLEKEY